MWEFRLARRSSDMRFSCSHAGGSSFFTKSCSSLPAPFFHEFDLKMQPQNLKKSTKNIKKSNTNLSKIAWKRELTQDVEKIGPRGPQRRQQGPQRGPGGPAQPVNPSPPPSLFWGSPPQGVLADHSTQLQAPGGRFPSSNLGPPTFFGVPPPRECQGTG